MPDRRDNSEQPTGRDAYEVLQVHPKADLLIIQAAFRILAAKYHPDRDPSPGATRRMAELNAAYEAVRTADRREVYDRQRKNASASVPIVTPYGPRPPASGGGSSEVLDFGRYEGWSLQQIALQDPDYLQWLARHTSGVRYRRRIAELLDARSAKRTAPKG